MTEQLSIGAIKQANTARFGARALMVSICTSMLLLSGCQPADKAAETHASEVNDVETQTATETTESNGSESQLHQGSDSEAANTEPMVSTRNQQLSIDWKAVDSGVSPIDPASFNYPFEQQSSAVQSQASFSNITPQQAQHSLTLGMTSNEPLEKILDQLGDSYLSHNFSPETATLTIYTTPNVTAVEHDYVIADEFARGLILPIKVTSEMPATKETTASTADTPNASESESE
ncbi:hypothetical protein [Psychrobacter sp. FDAARGOS_221]|uniref:hypothetical protein n=1 Tax=Psychrobacter sp. FDAARGOS_221 TaxID=1975705 RepID=UPI000BB5354A|nr:hypothetical protein [Psychrobacter sp. FDAARGOS_221]PNK60284.1 hypothetical protein A6J60_004965 [Psychrobacter sp. FDAARGOS_221]